MRHELISDEVGRREAEQGKRNEKQGADGSSVQRREATDDGRHGARHGCEPANTDLGHLFAVARHHFRAQSKKTQIGRHRLQIEDTSSTKATRLLQSRRSTVTLGQMGKIQDPGCEHGGRIAA